MGSIDGYVFTTDSLLIANSDKLNCQAVKHTNI